MRPRISSDSGKSGGVPSTNEPISAPLDEDTSYVRPLHGSEPIPSDYISPRIGGQSLSYPLMPMVDSATAATEPLISDLAEVSQVFMPFWATDIDRHSGKPLINANEEVLIIRAGRRVYDDPNDPSPGTPWRSCTHPQGALYFSYSRRRIFTDNDVRINTNLNEIDKCVVKLTDLATSKGISFPDPNLELVLKLVSKKDSDTQEKLLR
ncbi:hypothetical protein J3A83DRAFT_4371803 [Scleroderma citrinum]